MFEHGGTVNPVGDLNASSWSEYAMFHNTGHDPRYATPYPICNMRWGSRFNVTVMDLVILSSYAYQADEETLARLVHQSFGQSAEVVHFDEYRSIPRSIG